MTYETFKGNDNRYYFRFLSRKNGKTILISYQSYDDVREAEKVMKEVTIILTRRPRGRDTITHRKTSNGKKYFTNIKNKGGKNLARGTTFYDTLDEVKEANRKLTL